MPQVRQRKKPSQRELGRALLFANAERRKKEAETLRLLRVNSVSSKPAAAEMTRALDEMS